LTKRRTDEQHEGGHPDCDPGEQTGTGSGNAAYTGADQGHKDEDDTGGEPGQRAARGLLGRARAQQHDHQGGASEDSECEATRHALTVRPGSPMVAGEPMTSR